MNPPFLIGKGRPVIRKMYGYSHMINMDNDMTVKLGAMELLTINKSDENHQKSLVVLTGSGVMCNNLEQDL